jgi:CP family cyanate transporter-like MFS transporter
MFAVALNLRPAAASMGPLLHRIQAETGLTSGWAGALTTLPVLCFGALAPTAPVLARRVGPHATIALTMWLLAAGLLLRLISGMVFLFLGTALAGCAIAIGNVLLPVLVRRDFPGQTGTAMGVFTASLIGFAALAAGATVPIANTLGGGWRPGLGIWAIPAVVAGLVWLPVLTRRGRSADEQPADAPDAPRAGVVRRLLRHPLAWQLTLFFALQSGGFYAALAWLPSIFRSHGFSEAHAGALLSLSLVVGLIAALLFPRWAEKVRDQRWLVVSSCLLTGAGWLGVLLAPRAGAYIWAALLGLGQQAQLPLVFMLIVLRSGSVSNAASLSTMAQSIGYAGAALAPLAVGALHGATQSWTPELILLIAVLVPQLLLGLASARDRHLFPKERPSVPAQDPDLAVSGP